MKKNFKNIAEFIDLLDEMGELIRVKEQVSPILEISKITDEQSKSKDGGKALLFENVWDNGKKTFPIATNLFGSNKRMALSLGLDSLEEAGSEISKMINLAPPQSFMDFFNLAKDILPMRHILPKKIKGKAASQQVIQTGDDIDLSQIPVLQCWKDDGGRFVTLPLVFTKSLKDSKRNLGMYRLQVYDKNTTGMHWHIHKDGSHYFNEYKQAKKRMPVAVAIGADPSVIYAATAPMPRGIDELLLAGFFRKKPVELVDCVSVDLQVPAEAEFVLEGYVDYDELRLEGPFGDHTGYYSLADMYPVFHITALTRKQNPIYCATLVGPPPMEDCYMAKATERIFLPMLKIVMPEVVDYFLPWEGVFHNIVIVSIKKEYPAHAHKVISGLWGQNQMSFCKSIIVVDEDVDVADLSKIWLLILNSCDFEKDLILSYGVLDVLDHSSDNAFVGSKLGLDLTAKIDNEKQRQALAFSDIENVQDFQAKLKSQISGIDEIFVAENFCAIAIDKLDRAGKDILKSLSEIEDIEKYFRGVALFDKNIEISNTSKLLWKVFNNVDPARDILIKDNRCIFIDASKKISADGYTRQWPDDLDF